MKIAIYRGAFEGQETSVTIHETQGTIYATLEVNARPVPPALQSTAQRSLLEACKQHTKQARATSTQPEPAQTSQSEPARALVLPTSLGQTKAPRAEQPGSDHEQPDQPEGRRFVTRMGGEEADPSAQTDRSASAKDNHATSRTKESALLGATRARPRVPAQRPSRRMRELIDA